MARLLCRFCLAGAFLVLGSCFKQAKTFEWNRSTRISSSAALIDNVDPFIGSAGVIWARGHTSPAASSPFGLVKLGPESALLSKRFSHSGYSRNDPEIVGFSHTRYVGTGVAEGGLLLVKPMDRQMSYSSIKTKRFVIDRRMEKAHPGYYSIYLHQNKIKAEFTALDRAGVHRYSFEEDNPYIYIHLNSKHGAKVEEIAATVSGSSFEVSGRLYGGFSQRYGGLPFFASASLSHSILSSRFLSKNETSSASSLGSSDSTDWWLELQIDAEAGEDVLLYLGLSYTDMSGAQTNLATVDGSSFDGIRSSTEDQWQSVLEKIQISGGTKDQQTIFYSAVYRSFLMPTRFGDPDGRYRGFDDEISSASFDYYSDFSLWDTFRTVHPLYNLIAQDEQSDMMNSLLLMQSKGGGRLPRWASGAGFSNSMLGFPAVIALSEAVLKGVALDANTVLNAVSTQLDSSSGVGGQECFSSYVSRGFCSSGQAGSVSYSLEYAYADHSASLLAENVGNKDLQEEYRARSDSALRNHFDNRYRAFLPLDSNGKFQDLGPSGPSWKDSSYLKLGRTGKAFVEGGIWHWRFYSFFNTELTEELYSGSLSRELKKTLSKAKPSLGNAFPPYFYWHGNEPGFTQPLWFSLLGNMSESRRWVHWVLNNKYANSSHGLDGDDDAGTLSAWYVLASMGIFPVAGSDRYALVTPLFDEITIQLASSKTLVIRKDSNSSTVQWNGESLDKYEVGHSVIAEGGTLVFGGN